MRPILLSFQRITREGLNTAIEWFPLLAPAVITLTYLLQTCQLPCELHHLLVPLAPSHRGWMEPHQQRHMAPGNYFPGWWDLRRQPPGQEDGDDDNSHLQVSTVRACGTLSYPHVADLWCDNTVFHTPAQHVDMTHHEIPFDISVGNDALFLMQRGAIKKRRTTEPSQSTTPIVQAFHVYRLSTTYELVPAPPPEPGSDVPGHILGLMSTHLGFETTEPARCHPISATIQGMMTLPAFIYEHSGDSFSQQYTDDILALVDITIRGQDNTEHKIRRVLWLRTASTRSALLNTLRCGDICEVMNPPEYSSTTVFGLNWTQFEDTLTLGTTLRSSSRQTSRLRRHCLAFVLLKSQTERDVSSSTPHPLTAPRKRMIKQGTIGYPPRKSNPLNLEMGRPRNFLI